MTCPFAQAKATILPSFVESIERTALWISGIVTSGWYRLLKIFAASTSVPPARIRPPARPNYAAFIIV